jgi:hypothetical protein
MFHVCQFEVAWTAQPDDIERLVVVGMVHLLPICTAMLAGVRHENAALFVDPRMGAS